jgi:hypothetical protein
LRSVKKSDDFLDKGDSISGQYHDTTAQSRNLHLDQKDIMNPDVSLCPLGFQQQFHDADSILVYLAKTESSGRESSQNQKETLSYIQIHELRFDSRKFNARESTFRNDTTAFSPGIGEFGSPFVFLVRASVKRLKPSGL